MYFKTKPNKYRIDKLLGSRSHAQGVVLERAYFNNFCAHRISTPSRIIFSCTKAPDIYLHKKETSETQGAETYTIAAIRPWNWFHGICDRLRVRVPSTSTNTTSTQTFSPSFNDPRANTHRTGRNTCSRTFWYKWDSCISRESVAICYRHPGLT